MKVIQPNCRVQFTAEDIDFIVTILGRRSGDQNWLIELLSDQEARDSILDDQALFSALLEHRGCLKISTHFYFYILVRHVLRRTGIEDRAVADYVAEILAEYSHTERTRCTPPGSPAPLDYFFEMLAALQTADDRSRFLIRAHMGNHALFLAGVFPERIRFRAETKGFPDLQYFEDMGRTSFRVASDHRLAQEYDLAPIFDVLADRFKTARLALNDLADRLVSIGDANDSINSLLHQPESFL
jgi:hypothetical protein